jgi:hypothetical protein
MSGRNVVSLLLARLQRDTLLHIMMNRKDR